jgi:hypothetical protein
MLTVSHVILNMETQMLRSTDTSTLEELLPTIEQGSRRSLGAMLVLKRQASGQEVDAEIGRSFDLDDSANLKRWERRLSSHIYRVYGYEPEAGWEFFALLEFADLEAWQQLQEYLDTSGFSAYYTWDIVALGRRMG